MAATAISEQAVNGPYVLETATQFTTLTETASDPTNMNKVVMSRGRCLVLFHNSSADTDYWVTVDSTNDPYGRVGDINQEDIGFGEWGARIFEGPGWEQTLGGRDLLIDTENAAVKIIAIPL